MKWVVVIMVLLGANLYGGSSGFFSYEEIDRLHKNTDKIFKKVDKSYDIIEKSATGKSVYSVLEKYATKDEAKLTISWFRMATQLSFNRKMAFLINNSSDKVKALLSKLSLDKKNPLERSEKKFIFSKIDYLVDRTAIDRAEKLDETHTSLMNLFIRSMPIINKLTKKRGSKQFKVLKKGEKFKLLYKLSYKGKNGYPLLWGFIERVKDNQQGWININKLNIK